MKNFPKINLVYDALHGMACYIFLKSMRSLAEFRKNPHVKIPPKSPSTNFQSLGKFKNPILIQKFLFFLIFGRSTPRPAWPLARPAHRPRRSRRPKSPGRPIQPARQSRLRGKYVFLYGSRLPEPAASTSSLCQPGPIGQMCLPHCADQPRSLSSVPSGHPASLDLRPRDARQDN
jgi:hypothetical protein